jgi:hypothetical protein
MYFYCYVYVFLLLCMFCSVYSVFIVPNGTLRLPWLTFFCAFSSAVRQIPGYNFQRRDTPRTLPKLTVLFCLLFVCKFVLYYCHRLSTQLQLTNISIYLYLSTSFGMKRVLQLIFLHGIPNLCIKIISLQTITKRQDYWLQNATNFAPLC